MADIFEYFTGLRGFHVYSNTVNWKPHIGQKVSFKREHNNTYDRFAVAGTTLLEGRIGAVTVGHIPRELSRYTWYAIQEGATFEATVHDTKAKPSPLIQGGLEIQIKVKVVWSQEEKLSILKAKVEDVNYPMTGEYNDDSKNILNEIGVHNEEDGDHDDEELEEDEEEQDLQIVDL